jgi:hypothetical protein
VIASHIAEHLADPAAFAREISRVSRAGYVETPSPLADVLLHEDYHVWRVSKRRGNRLHFRGKGSRSALAAAIFDPFYKIYNAPQACCERPTITLPAGPIGRVLRLLLRLIGGTVNRSGIFHTRCYFGPGRPLECEVEPKR